MGHTVMDDIDYGGIWSWVIRSWGHTVIRTLPEPEPLKDTPITIFPFFDYANTLKNKYCPRNYEKPFDRLLPFYERKIPHQLYKQNFP